MADITAEQVPKDDEDYNISDLQKKVLAVEILQQEDLPMLRLVGALSTVEERGRVCRVELLIFLLLLFLPLRVSLFTSLYRRSQEFIVSLACRLLG